MYHALEIHFSPVSSHALVPLGQNVKTEVTSFVVLCRERGRGSGRGPWEKREEWKRGKAHLRPCQHASSASKCDGRLRDYATLLTMHIDMSPMQVHTLCTPQSCSLCSSPKSRLNVQSARYSIEVSPPSPQSMAMENHCSTSRASSMSWSTILVPKVWTLLGHFFSTNPWRIRSASRRTMGQDAHSRDH